jgi:hypothetical protein
MNTDFLFEYEFNPSPVAAERLAQAWDLILTLIIEDLKSEQNQPESESENAGHDPG